MSFFSRLGNLAKGQVNVLRKRFSEEKNEVDLELESGPSAASPQAERPEVPTAPSVERAEEPSRELDSKPEIKKRL